MKKTPRAGKAGGSQPRPATPVMPTKSMQLPPARFSPRNWLILAVCVALAAASTWAFFEYVVWNKLPGVLVGKWVVEGGPQDGATFDFYRNGTMRGRINLNGREGIIQADVSVEAGQLQTTTRNPNTRQSETRSQTIKMLTRHDLILEDERGQVLRLARADE